MSVTISPAGLSAAPVANTLAVLVSYRERLCKSYCVDSTIQPQVTVTYKTGTARQNGTTVFIPITATISVVTQNDRCGCDAHTQLFTETFVVAFQGRTALPASVTINNLGRDIQPSCVNCGCAHGIAINDSLTIVIPAAPAAPAA